MPRPVRIPDTVYPSFRLVNQMNTLRITFLATLVCALLMPADALIGAAIVSGFTTFITYGVLTATLGPIGPVATAALFTGTTFAIDYAADAEYKRQVAQRVQEALPDNLAWHNCSAPATVRVFPYCTTTGKKHYATTTCTESVSVVGNHGCNACGANSLVATRLVNPTDLSDRRAEYVCKTRDNVVLKAAPIATQRGYWECGLLPHYKECQLCGPGTASAGYSHHMTRAGLLLNCVRDGGAVEQMFVQRMLA